MLMVSALTVTYSLAGLCAGFLANILINRSRRGKSGASVVRRFPRGAKVYMLHLLVCIICGVLFAGMAAYTGSWIASAFLCVLAFVLLCVSCIDIYSQQIPDIYLLFAAVAGILWITASYFAPLGAPVWHDALLGALAGALPLFLIDRLTILLLDKDAFGYGDMKLMAMAGLFLGVKLTLLSLALAIIAGGVFGAVLLCSRRIEKGSYIAFGPFLSVGVLTVLWFGHALIGALFSR